MIYISLTTVPIRLSHWTVIEKNLNYLLHQKTDKEYYVIFNIPYLYAMNDNEEYVIPHELIDFAKDNPKLIINRDTIDYGPIIKTYGALKYSTNPEDVIIALDDDIGYHEDLIERYLEGQQKYPEYVLCFAGDIGGQKINLDPEGNEFNIVHAIYQYPLTEDTFMLSPGHTNTVCSKRKFFEDDFNPKLFALADGDDPLIAYYHKLHNRPIIALKHFYPEYLMRYPCVDLLTYLEPAGGWLIRQKCPGCGTHGRQSPQISNLLFHGGYVYTKR